MVVSPQPQHAQLSRRSTQSQGSVEEGATAIIIFGRSANTAGGMCHPLPCAQRARPGASASVCAPAAQGAAPTWLAADRAPQRRMRPMDLPELARRAAQVAAFGTQSQRSLEEHFGRWGNKSRSRSLAPSMRATARLGLLAFVLTAAQADVDSVYLNDGTKRDLLEFVLPFAGPAPYYLKSFARWG